MSRFFVSGGCQRQEAQGDLEWFNYGEALLLEFDDSTFEVTERIRYETPPANRPDDPQSSIVFKAGSTSNSDLVLCTQTEVLVFDSSDFSLKQRISHPWFNDIHHAIVNSKGNFLVANTGLDMVMEIDQKGNAIQDWGVLEGVSPWDRFDRSVDYRKVVTTKPHEAHPNYVFEYDDQVWATRFVQRNSVCVSQPGRTIDIGGERIHDGHILGDKVFFTSVDGKVIVSNLVSGKVECIHDLNQMTDTDKTLGWCRGIHLISADRVLIGFSRLRPSKIKENLRWVKFKIGMREDAGKLPTRICCYNFVEKTVEWTLDLEKHGLNAVFSIIPVPEGY